MIHTDDRDRPPSDNEADARTRARSTSMLVACALYVLAGCTDAGRHEDGGGAPAGDSMARSATRPPATLASHHAPTATALYVALEETPVPPAPQPDGFPPLVDWHLDVERAPCAGETMVLRSVIDFGLDSRLATEFDVRNVSGDLWFEYPSDVLSIVRSRPGPTHAGHHGLPQGVDRAVWEGVALAAGDIDVREVPFFARKEHDHQVISAWFELDPSGSTISGGRDPGPQLGQAWLFLQVGGPNQAPQAVENSWEIDTEDNGSRCASPTATARP